MSQLSQTVANVIRLIALLLACFASTFTPSLLWGRCIDSTGFYSIGARPYGPQFGRFLSADPLGHAASIDLYSLGAGDALNNVDPTGRCLSSFNGGDSTPYAGAIGMGMAGLGAISTQSTPYETPTYTDGAIGNANKYYDQQFSTGLNKFVHGDLTGIPQAGISFAASTLLEFSPVNGGVEQSWQNAGAAWGEGRYAASFGNGFMGTLPTALTVATIGEFSMATSAAGRTFAVGEVMPSGQIAGMGPGAMYTGETALPATLYRGVARGSVHDVQQAVGGSIVPKGGSSSAYLHVNEGMTNSPFTSWTSDITVARRFAGSNGSIFSVNPGNVSNEVISTAPFSRLPSEQEFLIRGSVSGVKRLP